MRKYWVSISATLLALLLGFTLGGIAAKRGAKQRYCPPVVADTVTVTSEPIYDTVYIDKPVPYVSRQLRDSMSALVHLNDIKNAMIDSLLTELGNPPMDTIVEINVPRWQKEYRDTTYHAWVSGYEPALDSIQVYNKTVYQTVTIHEYQPKKKWAVGIQAGMGVGLNDNKVITTPYIGVGLTYKLFEF